MKRVLLLFFLLLGISFIGFSKTYLHVHVEFSGLNSSYSNMYSDEIDLFGDIPSDMEKHYEGSSPGWTAVLNQICSHGYELEQMSSDSSSSIHFIFSRPGSPDSDYIQAVTVDDDVIKEVARYNLQGLPVSSNEKGIQIIVYSNYTTKTLIVE